MLSLSTIPFDSLHAPNNSSQQICSPPLTVHSSFSNDNGDDLTLQISVRLQICLLITYLSPQFQSVTVEMNLSSTACSEQKLNSHCLSSDLNCASCENTDWDSKAEWSRFQKYLSYVLSPVLAIPCHTTLFSERVACVGRIDSKNFVEFMTSSLDLFPYLKT